MKFSKLSTIFFDDNDFQSKSRLDMPIVPRGQELTIVELSEGFDITLLTATPSMPTAIDIVNVRTSIRTTIANTATAPCVFSGIVPKSLRPGIYRAEFLVRQTQRAVSAPFRVVAGNDWAAIRGNSPSEKYSDGTSSIIGGRLIQFVQYFSRKAFRLAAVENNTFYDDERGTSFSLQNKNYSRYHLEGYAGERTTAAISMLLAGGFSWLQYNDGGGNKTTFSLRKSGDLSTEAVGRGFCQFSGDFNGMRKNFAVINFEEAAELWGIEFGTNKNMKVRIYPSATDVRVPTAVFCQPFTNIAIEKKDGTLFQFDTTAHFSRLTFTEGTIPDNFGRSLRRLNVDAIRQGDKVTKIGDNVNLANGSTAISADFPSINTIGRNVTIGKFSGSLQFSNNAVFDNLKFKGSDPVIFCKNAIFKNCKLMNYTFVGSIAELHNVQIRATDFNARNINNDALLVGCKFEYDGGSYRFDAQRLIDCRMVGTYDANTNFDLTKYTGAMLNSFTYQRLSVATDSSTSTFTLDEKSLHGYIQDSGAYLASIQRIDGRDIDNAGFQPIRFTIANNIPVYDYTPTDDTILTTAGAQVARSVITSAAVGETMPADLLSDVTLSGSLTINVRGDLGGSNFNNVSGSSSRVRITGSKLLELLQSGGSYFNSVNFTLYVNNDLPSGFSYLLFKTNPNVLQNLSLTVNVTNDPNSYLTNRLRELYPTFTINSI